VLVCLYVGLKCVVVCMCGFCNVWVCVFLLVFIGNMFHYKVLLHVLSFLILNYIIASKIVI